MNRRLLGCGRKPMFVDLEEELFLWIRNRNSLGLRVKDKFIVGTMIRLRDDRLKETTDESQKDLLRNFKVSKMWLERFKTRKDLVSRRETSCRTLPDGFQQTCRDFIERVSITIRDKKIKLDNIFNLDQVPRYIELGSGRTITVRGSTNVALKKASTSHKKFTFTPVISAGGKVVGLHVLFSKLKNKPTVHENVTVDVNESGMWSQEILKSYIDNVLLNRIQTCFHEPVLILLDSYGAHLKYLSSEMRAKYAKRNVYFDFIPPNMTGLLQPLDVCINRSFQKFFDDCYTEHLNMSLQQTTNRTARGNIRLLIGLTSSSAA